MQARVLVVGAGPVGLTMAAELARYGVPARTVLDMIRAVGTLPVGEVTEGQLRFPLVVRLPERSRADPESIGAILVALIFVYRSFYGMRIPDEG